MEDIYPGCVKEFYEAGAEYRNLILMIKKFIYNYMYVHTHTKPARRNAHKHTWSIVHTCT